MLKNKINRREFLRLAGIGTGAVLLSACAPQVVTQVVKETEIVKETVKETQLVEVPVEVVEIVEVLA